MILTFLKEYLIQHKIKYKYPNKYLNIDSHLIIIRLPMNRSPTHPYTGCDCRPLGKVNSSENLHIFLNLQENCNQVIDLELKNSQDYCYQHFDKYNLDFSLDLKGDVNCYGKKFGYKEDSYYY